MPLWDQVLVSLLDHLQCESTPPPLKFSDIFPKRSGILVQILNTYYAFLSTLGYKFLFNYLQL